MDPAKFYVPSPSAIPTGRVIRAEFRNYLWLMPEGKKQTFHPVAALPERPSRGVKI